MRFKKEKRINPRIDLTSLIDVIFNIVLFLMVSTTMISQPAIKVNLPQATTNEIEKLKDLTVTLTKDGQFFLNDKRTTLADFKRDLSQIVDKSMPDSLLVVRADMDVRHGDVVMVMDDAKQAGVKRLALATESKQD